MDGRNEKGQFVKGLYKNLNKHWLKTNCEICKKEFEYPFWRMRRGSVRFCSNKCRKIGLVGNSNKLRRPVYTICLVCNKQIRTIVSDPRTYCSLKCRGRAWSKILLENPSKWKHLKPFPKGHIPKSVFKKGHIPWDKNRKCPELSGNKHHSWKGGKPKCLDCGKQLTQYDAKYCRKHAEKLRSGENAYQWKGDKVGYSCLHVWVRKHLGTPNTCEHCGKSGLKGQDIQWANRSGEYKRDLSDWIRLCVPCHIKYDKRTT
jgi:hypothetical protein